MGPATQATAQSAAGQQAPGLRSDSLARDYFTARFVLTNAETVGVTDEQRTYIETEASNAASAFVGLRFDLDTALRRTIGLSNVHPIDEEAIVRQLEAVLDLERQIKVLQVRMAVRIKNALTPAQHDQLMRIRRAARLRQDR
jgi:Spy/CpxP family protein refolding chaperone